MTPRARLWQDTRRLLQVSLPLMVSHLSQMGMAITDTMWVGRYSAVDLAAVALGSNLLIPIQLACIGVLMGLNPTLARLLGAGRPEAGGYWYRQTLWLAAALALLATLAVLAAPALLARIGVDAAVTDHARAYLHAIAWGVPANVLFLVPRFANEGLANTRITMYVQLAIFGLNIPLDYLLIYGPGGFPALGAAGAGWATAAMFWLAAVALFAYTRWSPVFRRIRPYARGDGPQRAAIASLLGIGLPIAVSLVLEIGLFSTVALLMGRLGTTAVAAHQVAVTYVGTSFMVTLGLATGLTIQVGRHLGAGDPAGAKRVGQVGITLAVGWMLVSAGVALTLPETLPRLYTEDPEVIAIASGLMVMAALFQVSDGLQVSVAGVLRGYKDTFVPMGYTIIAYWGIGLPLAFWGLHSELGPRGPWLGLIAGLTAAGLLLLVRFLGKPTGNPSEASSHPLPEPVAGEQTPRSST